MVDQGLDLAGFGEVGPEERRRPPLLLDLADGGAALLGVAVADDDLGPLAAEGQGRGQADPSPPPVISATLPSKRAIDLPPNRDISRSNPAN